MSFFSPWIAESTFGCQITHKQNTYIAKNKNKNKDNSTNHCKTKNVGKKLPKNRKKARKKNI